MAEFGIFTPITFVDGTSPAINAANLNELERVVNLADKELATSQDIKLSELLQYFFERNVKEFPALYPSSGWTNSYPTFGDLYDESDINIADDECLGFEIISATASYLTAYKTLTATLDFSTFNDGSSSGTGDCIAIWFYCSDSAAFDYLDIKLGDDNTNYYVIAYSGFSTGWNAVYPQKSWFTTVGSPTGWNSIDYIAIAPRSTASNIGDFILMQRIFLYRQDPIFSGYTNAFQRYMGSVSGWENYFSISADLCGLYFDTAEYVSKLGIIKFDGEAQPSEMDLYCDTIDFTSKFEFYSKYRIFSVGRSASITWEVDTDNYATVYIKDDVFYLDVVEATVLTSNSVSIETLRRNEKFYFYIKKEGQTIRAILQKDGSEISILEHETTISSSSEGCIYLGQDSAYGISFLTDFIISNKPIQKLIDEDLPTYVRNGVDTQFADNSIANVNNMVSYLAPNKTYLVELFLSANNGNATPNIKLAWVLTGCEALTDRTILGPNSNTTDVDNTNVRVSSYGISNEIEYGIDSTVSPSLIKETFLIKSGREGGKIQLQAAQYYTDAVNVTTVEDTSHMILTPINAKI